MEDPLPLSSLKLLVPPLRIMSAVMWKVVLLRFTKYYGKVEEFVSMVAETIPDILTDRQKRLLTLGLKAKMTLQMLSSEQPQNLTDLKTRLNSLLTSSSKEFCTEDEALEENFVRLVQTLLEDPKGRAHFLENVFPEEYGADFDSALETLLCEFFTRLEEMLRVPDFKQAAVLISDAPSVLEDCIQCVSEDDDVRVLLKKKAFCSQTAKMATCVSTPSEQRLFSSLSLRPPLQDIEDKDVETDTQAITNQRETDGLSFQEEEDFAEQDATVLPDEVENTEERSDKQEPRGTKCNDNNSASSSTYQAPATTTQSHVFVGPLRQRVAHKCPQCGKCFIYRHKLLEHQRVHTGENPYKCSQCGKSFRRTSDMSTHRRTQCTKAAYMCIKCGDSFQSVQDKIRHRCGKIVPRFDCSVCGKIFKKIHLRDKHQLSHTQARIFKCRRCGTVFTTMNELRNHQKNQPGELSNQCVQCGKIFSSSACLAAHELRHRQKGAKMCVHCGKAFKNKYALKLHMRSHTGERPFECTYCGKRFSVSGNLNIHIRIHTGEKPYLCSDCGKAFVSAGELQIHRRTHTGEKPYKCTTCGKGFTMASKLTIHTRIHSGNRPYVCLECGKGFSRGYDLKKHNMSHTGVRPYVCQLCGKTYTCTNHLRRHLKTHSVINQTA